MWYAEYMTRDGETKSGTYTHKYDFMADAVHVFKAYEIENTTNFDEQKNKYNTLKSNILVYRVVTDKGIATANDHIRFSKIFTDIIGAFNKEQITEYQYNVLCSAWHNVNEDMIAQIIGL